MGTNQSPRVALAGIVLESNSFAPVVGEEDFRNRYYFEGPEILEQAAAARLSLSSTLCAGNGRMSL